MEQNTLKFTVGSSAKLQIRLWSISSLWYATGFCTAIKCCLSCSRGIINCLIRRCAHVNKFLYLRMLKYFIECALTYILHLLYFPGMRLIMMKCIFVNIYLISSIFKYFIVCTPEELLESNPKFRSYKERNKFVKWYFIFLNCVFLRERKCVH